MTASKDQIATIRQQIDALVDSIKVERSEQPFQMMSSADLRSYRDKVEKLQERLTALIELSHPPAP